MCAVKIQLKPKCPKCGSRMILKETERYTYPSGRPRKFFSCSRYPQCDGILAAHPNGTPASTPADWQTRQLRILTHQLAEKIWGGWKDPNVRKKAMYRWLERHTRSVHIGHMQRQELIDTIAKMNVRLNQDNHQK